MIKSAWQVGYLVVKCNYVGRDKYVCNDWDRKGIEVHFEKTKKKKDMSNWGDDTNDNDYEYLGIITYDRILGDLTIKCEMEKEDFSLGVDLCAELQDRYENDEVYVYDVRFDASKAIALVEFKLKEKTYTYSY